ncbi:MAG: phosphopyruvate hydratase [Opitutaceae bacterium]|nr:phosphopyruvate hydratase [Opitutaceae bacterium]
MKISKVEAFQIFDSRGFPTVECHVTLENGSVGCGLVPSGASTGQFEAFELRDGGEKYLGKSVFQAIENITTKIAPNLIGKNASKQAELDQEMIELDGTKYKSRLGANAILSVSMAIACASAESNGQPLHDYMGNGEGTLLPLPEIQIIGGGAHASWRTDIQDFLVIAIGARSFSETLEMTFNVYRTAGRLLQERGKLAGLADEGGYWPDFSSHREVLDFLVESIELAGYRPGTDLGISLDIAASDLFDASSGKYRLALEQEDYDSDEFMELQLEWCRDYPIVSIEDPLADDDWASWKYFSELLGSKVQIIGDDLFTTNPEKIIWGIEEGVANAVLIKPNQIGTVTETLEAIRLTQKAGWNVVISARSGETEDAFISHLGVATNAGQLKVGSFARGERMVKWNEVLRIERELGDRARFIGGSVFG